MGENREEFQRELEAIEAKVIELFAMVAEDLPNVKNYDGSWTEYGSLVGVPIELGEGK